MSGLVLGLDVGTSAVKAVVVDRRGKILGRGRASYPTFHPHALAYEQNPEDWVAASIQAILKLNSQMVRGIETVGITGHMSSLVLASSNGQPIRNAILLADGRSLERLGELTAVAPRLMERIGARPATVFLLPKLLWVRRHEPDTYRSIAKIMGTKDYVRLVLTNQWGSDASEMGNSLALDLGGRRWMDDILRDLGVPLRWWPPLMESNQAIGRMTQAIAQKTGIRQGTPVVCGAADMATTLLGAGVTNDKQILVATGSSMPAVRLMSGFADEAYGLTYHLTVDGSLYGMASMLGAGMTFQWWAELLGMDLRQLEQAAQDNGAPNSSDPLWLPFLNGRGTPDFNPMATGALSGLIAAHGRPSIAAGIYAGVACHIVEGMAGLLDSRPTPTSLIVAGGGASLTLATHLAGLTGIPIDVIAESDVSAYGAARLAAQGVWGKRWDKPWGLPDQYVYPDESTLSQYRSLFTRYVELVNRMRSLWRRPEDEGGKLSI